MKIDKARRVRDLAQEVVRLIDAATARAHREREAGPDPRTRRDEEAMTTYTHDNGIIVTSFEDGRLYFDEDGRSAFFAADEAAAIHAAYLHSLGLALWEHDGERWLILLEGRGSRRGRYVLRLSDHSALWADPVLPLNDSFDGALAAYLAAHTPPAQPQPGERWLLDKDGPVEQPVEVVEVGGELYFAWQDGTMPMLVRVADRHPSTYGRAES